MALFKILKGAEENLSSQKKREGFAYFTTDSNDFYIDVSSDEGDVAGERKQLNANRAHYIVSKNLYENAEHDKLYIGDEQISLGRTRGESDYENGLKNAGLNSVAVGIKVSATGEASQSFGRNTVASGNYSHVEGYETKASSEAQHVQGKYNINDVDDRYAHIVGNGTSNERSNAHTIDWNGNAWFAGDAYVGGDSQNNGSKLSTESYVQDYSLPLITDENSEKYIIGIDAGGIYIMKK